jgi:hypothetical protein
MPFLCSTNSPVSVPSAIGLVVMQLISFSPRGAGYSMSSDWTWRVVSIARIFNVQSSTRGLRMPSSQFHPHSIWIRLVQLWEIPSAWRREFWQSLSLFSFGHPRGDMKLPVAADLCFPNFSHIKKPRYLTKMGQLLWKHIGICFIAYIYWLSVWSRSRPMQIGSSHSSGEIIPWTIRWNRGRKRWINVTLVRRIDWYRWNTGSDIRSPDKSSYRIYHQNTFWKQPNLFLHFKFYFTE